MRILKRKRDFINSRYIKHELSESDLRRVEVVRELLPEEARLILDIGCYDGAVSSFLKSADAIVIGLELSMEAALKAKEKIDEVIICDIEESLPIRDDVF